MLMMSDAAAILRKVFIKNKISAKVISKLIVPIYIKNSLIPTEYGVNKKINEKSANVDEIIEKIRPFGLSKTG